MHARVSHPRECCGFLLGLEGEGALRVSEVWPVPNAAPTSDRYEMTPESVLEIHRRAASRHLSVLASYHSHPDGAALPSEIDRAEAIPGLLQVILRTNGAPRAWMLGKDGVFEPVPVSASVS